MCSCSMSFGNLSDKIMFSKCPVAVFGCPDIGSLPGADVQRIGDTTLVTCHHRGAVQLLTCMDGRWVGILNCSLQGNNLGARINSNYEKMDQNDLGSRSKSLNKS